MKNALSAMKKRKELGILLMIIVLSIVITVVNPSFLTDASGIHQYPCQDDRLCPESRYDRRDLKLCNDYSVQQWIGRRSSSIHMRGL